MDSHEGEQSETCDCKVQLARRQRIRQRDVPRPLQCNKHMKQNRQQNIFLDNVCWKAKARPVQANIEITVPIEIVRAHEDMEIADSMDDDEEDEENGTSCQ